MLVPGLNPDCRAAMSHFVYSMVNGLLGYPLLESVDYQPVLMQEGSAAGQRNGRPRGHRCAGQATRGERILPKPRRPIPETRLSLLAREARTAQQMRACASKRPSAGGNIGSRRRAALAVQDFGLYGWPCACCGLG